MSVSRFCRFVDDNDKTHYGCPDDSFQKSTFGTEVELLNGDPYRGLSKSGNRAKVKKIICPLPSTPVIICIGLNYKSHLKESGSEAAAVPTVFMKPKDALSGPFDDISIHKCAQPALDYEVELCVIIAKDAKNVLEAEALDHVLGYTVGNDLSARNYQLPPMCGNQFCFAKSFDGFAPIGTSIVLSSAIPDPQDLRFTTKVNGELRQDSSTNEMIFNVRQIISHLSQGTTLREGTVIMTGTSAGVGHFMSPPGYLQDGDVVQCSIDGIGDMKNRIVFEK